MKCYICGAEISDMNNLNAMKNRPVDESRYPFGLSLLHCYIRCFECLLHKSYRLQLKTWKVRSRDGSKQAMELKKKEIQALFRTRMDLNVDFPKQGYGTSNDGNTARRFFADAKLSAEITGINQNLIHRFSVILKALASGFQINVAPFTEYCLSTASLFEKLYAWYYMPPVVHKLLIHGAAIVKEAILPIGILSEEAMEARNKDIRRFREQHTRKSSRKAANEDLFRRLLLTSDPFI
ncbi:uncharacterized protein LOC124169763 [Ischnura elegans]|uniref:uncharacterized protein LOC124169763 n=1 Tax=Ischnura elegans TaxID=197161 RepID=UPI001ED8AE7E|nr:uncharacterized protein LOC124169763 [Ischnura elegans]